jgi:hypothetical protein
MASQNQYNLEKLLSIVTASGRGALFHEAAEWMQAEGLRYVASVWLTSDSEKVEIAWVSGESFTHALGRICESVGLIPPSSFPPGGKWYSERWEEAKQTKAGSNTHEAMRSSAVP